MSTLTIYLTGGRSGGNVKHYHPINVKGNTTILFDYDGLNISDTNVSRIVLSPGDGSDNKLISSKITVDHNTEPVTYNFAKYSTNLPSESLEHEYNISDIPLTEGSDSVSLSAKVLVRYADYQEDLYIVPINLYRGSYYDIMDGSRIISTQILDNENSDIFCVVETKGGDIINVILS